MSEPLIVFDVSCWGERLALRRTILCLDTLLPRLLSDKNLPAAIEDVSGNQVPDSIKEKSEQLRAMGGLDAIQSKIYELPELLDRNREIIREVGGVNGWSQCLVKRGIICHID